MLVGLFSAFMIIFTCCTFILYIKFLVFNLQLPGNKIFGLAKFFLGIGIPGNAKDLYNQIDALACLESNR